MPEGPSIVILKEQVQQFKGKLVTEVHGNTKVDKERLRNKKIIDFKSWGKHFLICFKDFTVRIHLMLFGSYRIDERKPTDARLGLVFKNGELNFYACSVVILEEDLDEIYDWSADIMSDSWSNAKAKKKLKANPDQLVCDALLDQNIFAGSGNIVKNEVLFRIKVHPASRVGALPEKKLNELINETHKYAFQFYDWKKKFELKKHWQAHTKMICPRCDIPLKKEYLGKTNRRSFFCTNCQELYT
ncbi:MAG: endonuclease [Bacteroidetes bacterium]|nr:endonuclease [Bacteroidota bacterium]